MGRYTIQQVYLMNRLTVQIYSVKRFSRYLMIRTVVKPRVQWSPLEEPKQLGSEVDFTGCTAHDAAARLSRARDFPRSLHRHQTAKHGPALQGHWGCSSLASGLGMRSDTGPDIEHH